MYTISKKRLSIIALLLVLQFVITIGFLWQFNKDVGRILQYSAATQTEQSLRLAMQVAKGGEQTLLSAFGYTDMNAFVKDADQQFKSNRAMIGDYQRDGQQSLLVMVGLVLLQVVSVLVAGFLLIHRRVSVA